MIEKKILYQSPHLKTIVLQDMPVLCQSPVSCQNESYNENGDTSGWY